MSNFKEIEKILKKVEHLHPHGNFIEKMRKIYEEERILGIIRYLNNWQTQEHKTKRIDPKHRCYGIFCKCPTVAYGVANCVLAVVHKIEF